MRQRNGALGDTERSEKGQVLPEKTQTEMNNSYAAVQTSCRVSSVNEDISERLEPECFFA